MKLFIRFACNMPGSSPATVLVYYYSLDCHNYIEAFCNPHYVILHELYNFFSQK